MHVAGEAQTGKVIDQRLSKTAALPEPGNVVVGEVQTFEEIERLLKPRRKQEAAAGGQPAHEELEHRGPGIVMIQISLQHVELVKVGQQRAFKHGDTA